MLYEDAMCDDPCGMEPMGCYHCHTYHYRYVHDECEVVYESYCNESCGDREGCTAWN